LGAQSAEDLGGVVEEVKQSVAGHRRERAMPEREIEQIGLNQSDPVPSVATQALGSPSQHPERAINEDERAPGGPIGAGGEHCTPTADIEQRARGVGDGPRRERGVGRRAAPPHQAVVQPSAHETVLVGGVAVIGCPRVLRAQRGEQVTNASQLASRLQQILDPGGFHSFDACRFAAGLTMADLVVIVCFAPPAQNEGRGGIPGEDRIAVMTVVTPNRVSAV